MMNQYSISCLFDKLYIHLHVTFKPPVQALLLGTVSSQPPHPSDVADYGLGTSDGAPPFSQVRGNNSFRDRHPPERARTHNCLVHADAPPVLLGSTGLSNLHHVHGLEQLRSCFVGPWLLHCCSIRAAGVFTQRCTNLCIDAQVILHQVILHLLNACHWLSRNDTSDSPNVYRRCVWIRSRLLGCRQDCTWSHSRLCRCRRIHLRRCRRSRLRRLSRRSRPVLPHGTASSGACIGSTVLQSVLL